MWLHDLVEKPNSKWSEVWISFLDLPQILRKILSLRLYECEAEIIIALAALFINVYEVFGDFVWKICQEHALKYSVQWPIANGSFQTEGEKKSSRKHSNTESVLYSLFLNSTDEFDYLLLCLILLKMLLMDFLQTAAEMLNLGKTRTWLKIHSALGQTYLSTDFHLHQVQAASLNHI